MLWKSCLHIIFGQRLEVVEGTKKWPFQIKVAESLVSYHPFIPDGDKSEKSFRLRNQLKSQLVLCLGLEIHSCLIK